MDLEFIKKKKNVFSYYTDIDKIYYFFDLILKQIIIQGLTEMTHVDTQILTIIS